MESWEREFHWLRVRHFVKDSLGHAELPDLQAMLMLIGVQELGRWRKDFTKEEKQDLMHVGTCEVLCADGYYEFSHRDDEGWPHYQTLRPIDVTGHEAQEKFIQEKIIHYFDQWESTDASAEPSSSQPA